MVNKQVSEISELYNNHLQPSHYRDFAKSKNYKICYVGQKPFSPETKPIFLSYTEDIWLNVQKYCYGRSGI